MKTNFNDNWKFYLGDLEPRRSTDGWGGAKAKAYSFGATAMDLDDSKWRNVTLPHDYVSEGEYSRRSTESNSMTAIPEMESIDSRLFAGGSLEGGIGWYRKHFTLDAKDSDRILMHFDGIYQESTIYINEYYVKRNSSGYTAFVVDVTDFVNLQGDNLIAIRVDSTGREGWWYEGGGIYRDIWLEVKAHCYLEPWGIQVTYDRDVVQHKATVLVNAQVTSRSLQNETLHIRNIICEEDAFHKTGGKKAEIVESYSVLELDSWESSTVKSRIDISDLKLWDLDHPNLYKVITRVYQGDILLDSQETLIGFREMKFDADKGFFLNGKHVRIQGLCTHHDHAGVGIANYKDIWEYRLKQMKSMGMNAYRTAHHMASKDVLDLCDKLGILVMAEPRRMSSTEDDLKAFESLLKRDRNHPSIFIWGIGNEEIFSQDKPETARTTITMKKMVEKLDGTRPITSAVVCWNGKERFETAKGYEHVTKHLDVMGFNYCRTAWEPYHKDMPHQPILITEAGANSGTRGCYETNEEAGQYYIMDPDNLTKCTNGKKADKKDSAENEWKQFAESEYLSGIFLWTGMDYRGEPTPLSYPSVYTHFGIFDYCGFPKDNYYYYKSWWQEEPVLHLLPHWNHIGKEGQPLAVHCYSNMDEVELFVNGKSYGKKTMEKNWYLTWESVIYEPGMLEAIGYKDGVEVLREVVETTGSAYRLCVEPVKGSISAASGTAIFNISVVDESGREVPTADPLVYLELDGTGELLGTGNGNPGDHDSEKRPVRRAFNGKMQVVVRPTGIGSITLRTLAAGLYGASASVRIL